jgi:hypothetical protein
MLSRGFGNNQQKLQDEASLADPVANASRENREARRGLDGVKVLGNGGTIEDFKKAYNDFVDHVLGKLDAHEGRLDASEQKTDALHNTVSKLDARAATGAPYQTTGYVAPVDTTVDQSLVPRPVPNGSPDEVAATRLASTRTETSNPDDKIAQIESAPEGQTVPAETQGGGLGFDRTATGDEFTDV